MVYSAVAQAIGCLDLVWLIDHTLGDRWLLGDHGRLFSFDIIVILAAIYGRNVFSHAF